VATVEPSAQPAPISHGEPKNVAFDTHIVVKPIGFGVFLAIVRQNLHWIAILPLVAVALAGAILHGIPLRFQSQVALVVTKPQATLPVDTAPGTVSPEVSDQSLSSMLDEIKAAPIVERTINELHLDADPEFNPYISAEEHPRWEFVAKIEDALAPIFRTISAYLHPGAGIYADREILDNVTKAVGVSVKVASHTIVISAISTDPEKSAAIANAIANSFLSYRLEAQKAQAHQLERWLSDRLAELRMEVARQENEVERVRAKIGHYQGQTSSILSEQLSQISRELLDTKAQLADAEAKHSQLSLLTDNPTNSSADDVLNSLLIQNLRQQEAQLLAQRAAGQSEFGGRHPALISLNRQVNEVRQKIATEIGRIDQKVSEQIRVLTGKATALETAQHDLQTRIEAQNAALVHLRELQNDADSDRSTYQAFAIYRAKMAGTPTVEHTRVHVISPAYPEPKPISPNRKAILAVVGLGALVLAVAMSVYRAAFAQDLRSAEQAAALLNLPTLALIPKVRAPRPIDKLIVDQPGSALAESIRYLYTSIARTPPRRPGTALKVLVSSALPNEGKTTTSWMLAREAAMADVKTLLLNLDLRRRTAIKEAESTLDVNIETDKATGLDILNVRSRSRTVFAVLQRPSFWHQIEEMSARYDLLIIDSPPVLSVSDATTIARFADCTIFVVRWAKTRLPAVVEALRQLRSANVAVRGLVLSQVDVKKHAMYGFGDSGVYTGIHRKYYH
jgi:succinoglycan biosynthesis transport protein ExoP